MLDPMWARCARCMRCWCGAWRVWVLPRKLEAAAHHGQAACFVKQCYYYDGFSLWGEEDVGGEKRGARALELLWSEVPARSYTCAALGRLPFPPSALCFPTGILVIIHVDERERERGKVSGVGGLVGELQTVKLDMPCTVLRVAVVLLAAQPLFQFGAVYRRVRDDYPGTALPVLSDPRVPGMCSIKLQQTLSLVAFGIWTAQH